MSLKRYRADGWAELESVKRFSADDWAECESVKRWDGAQWTEVWGAYYEAVSSKRQKILTNYGTSYETLGEVTVSEDRLTPTLFVSWFNDTDPDDDSTYGSASVTISNVPVGAAVTFDYTASGRTGAHAYDPELSVNGTAVSMQASGSFSGTAKTTSVSIALRAGCTSTTVQIANLKIGGRKVRFSPSAD